MLRKALDEDRTKTFVVEISPLGLVEMTRQNVTDGVREIMTKACPVCSGEGVVKSEETIAIEFARHLRHLVIEAGSDGPEAYLLRINPKVTAWFIADGARELHAVEQETGRFFHFEGSDGLPLDHFAVTMEGTRAEIEEHAVPFRAGEEVHVNLVEPHMYNDDDAVAKVDGYLIDVVNGVHFVGEKKLVRIEEAGRTIARAVLVGADADTAEEAAKERASAREKAMASARRSATAKKSAARRREEAATATLVDESPVVAGTAPSAEEDSDAPRKRRRRRGGRGRGGGGAGESGDAVTAGADTADGTGRGRRLRVDADPGDDARATDETEAGGDVDGSADAAPSGRRPRRDADPGDDVAAAADTPEEVLAPKPRARRRRVTASSDETATVAADGAAADVSGSADDGTPVADASAATTPKPRARRSRAVAADEAPAAVVEEPAAEEAPKPRSRTRKAAPVEAEVKAVEEAPKPKGRTRKRPAEPAAEAAVEARDAVGEEPDEAPKPRGRSRKRPAEEAEEVEEAVKPAPKRRRKPAAEPSAEAAVEAREEVAEEPDGEDGDDDALSSRPRRRGRRGGRRRSRASSQADAEVSD